MIIFGNVVTLFILIYLECLQFYLNPTNDNELQELLDIDIQNRYESKVKIWIYTLEYVSDNIISKDMMVLKHI